LKSFRKTGRGRTKIPLRECGHLKKYPLPKGDFSSLFDPRIQPGSAQHHPGKIERDKHMAEKSPVFEKNHKYYLEQLAETDISSQEEKLGIQAEGDKALIRLFGKTYRVSQEGIFGPSGNKVGYTVSIILCKYLLHSQKTPTSNAEFQTSSDWAAYRDFRDAAPLITYVGSIEKKLAEIFSGKLGDLENACERLRGTVPDTELSYDLVRKFEALPKLPVLLLFNDADEEFPAQCSVLFEKSAEIYLDMECVAMVAGLLSGYLCQADEK